MGTDYDMTSIDLLPQSTYRPTSPVLVHGRRGSLNTIMEDDEESSRGSYLAPPVMQVRSTQKANWFSPLSDHFPTPRGNHFLSAPIVPSSPSSESSSCAPSVPWTKSSFATEDTNFDDLYDVSDDEMKRRSAQAQSERTSIASSTSSRRSLPALTIPPTPVRDHWAEVDAFKALTSPKGLMSPVPPTPPPKVPHSPAIFTFLHQSQSLPSSSAPPSLDGSLDSEQLAQLSAPPTPDPERESDDSSNSWGVQLQPAAMATLHALTGDDDDEFEHGDLLIELPEAREESMQEMQQVAQRFPPVNVSGPQQQSTPSTPSQLQSFNYLTRLDIPSPGGFFGSLSQQARRSWHLVPIPPTPKSAGPPSSTTAENFYNVPWSAAPVERTIEIPDRDDTDGPPTAIFIRPELERKNSSDETITDKIGETSFVHSPSLRSHQFFQDLQTLEEELIPDELDKGTVVAVELDRTALWLAAQHHFLDELINPKEKRDDEAALLQRAVSVKQITKPAEPEDIPAVPNVTQRKTVRFSEISIACPLPKTIKESTYFRAFHLFLKRTRSTDPFSHRIPRFEALQAQRVTFAIQHRNQLLGKYQLSVKPSSPTRRMSANVARGDELTVEDPTKVKREKEHEAFEQMSSAVWNVMAAKLLNGGRLINAPVAKRLARLSSMGPKMNGTPRDRARILDLGGQPTCDWAWQCAFEYPNCKIYTITTKALRQLSNSSIRGPQNHRHVAVERLTRLPFKDNQFDLISGRDIHSILKESAENGQNEWELCLAECMRVLKPGGYLDFNIMDSDVVNGGPLGSAKSVEFGFNLKTLGYDPFPTKAWLSRLKRSGFVGIKRAWVFLPMGARIDSRSQLMYRDSVGKEVPLQLEAMVSGSTDCAASIAGLVGGWLWEKWMLRCRVQTVGAEGALEGVQGIIEEGRGRNAGWRTLSGWARKPLH